MKKTMRCMGLCLALTALSFLFVLIGQGPAADRNAVINMPSSLLYIDDEAFMGIGAERVIVPDGTLRIGQKVFAGSNRLKFIQLPGSVSFIGRDVFGGNSEIVVSGPSGSYAQAWAMAANMRFMPGESPAGQMLNGRTADAAEERTACSQHDENKLSIQRALCERQSRTVNSKPQERAEIHSIRLYFP